MRSLILAAAVFFAPATYASATAIVAVWFPAHVIIGADAREITGDGRTIEVCKIRVVGNVIVAEAGVLDLTDKNGTTTKVDTLIRDQLNKGVLSSDQIPAVETMMFNIINDLYNGRNGPGIKPVDPQTIGSELFFVSTKGGYLAADHYAAGFDSGIGGIRRENTPCPSDRCTPGSLIYLGRHAEIRQVIDADPTIPVRFGPVDAIREVLKRVTDLIPEVVAPHFPSSRLLPTVDTSGLIKESVAIPTNTKIFTTRDFMGAPSQSGTAAQTY